MVTAVAPCGIGERDSGVIGGLTTRVFTGWMDAGDEGAVYAPHTYKGFVAPPRKTLLLVSNGLMAKFGT